MATSASQLGETADALVERIFEASLATFDIFAIYLGDRLGYYSTLCDHGPMTSQQLADRSNTHERYTREWLEQQAVSESCGGYNGYVLKAHIVPAGQ